MAYFLFWKQGGNLSIELDTEELPNLSQELSILWIYQFSEIK